MSWLEGGRRAGRASCVSHVGVSRALRRTHKTLRADAETEGGGASEAGRGSVQADSEGEGEGLVISDFDCTHTEPSASQRQHTTGGIHTHT